MENLEFVFCDYTDEYHCTMVAELINEYIEDPMGGGTKLTKLQQLRMVDGLATHPMCFVLFAMVGDTIVGLTTCFINFSTFKAKQYLNIHDVIVTKEMRGRGIGKALVNKCVEVAAERGYCKVTLEVRADNAAAQTVYKSLGFNECEPVMHFWTKML